MKRSPAIVVRLTDETRSVRVVLEQDPTEPGTIEDRKARSHLLQAIIDDPMLTSCQGKDFEKMVLYHDGTKWIADCSAVLRGKF